MNIHTIKVLAQFVEPLKNYTKTFEVRKDDRDYKVGDILNLIPFHNGESKKDQAIKKEITYVLKDPAYVKEGYVILGIKDPEMPEPFIPGRYQTYWSASISGTTLLLISRPIVNYYNKEDLFNLMNGMCYHTEDECIADYERQYKILSKYIQNFEEYIASSKVPVV